MRSLRIRIFLVAWPLVIAAAGVVAYGADRATVVELERRRPLDEATTAAVGQWAGRLGGEWPAAPESVTAVLRGARPPALASRGTGVLVGPGGGILAATDPGVRLVRAPAEPGGVAAFERSSGSALGGDVGQSAFDLSGVPVRAAGGRVVGALYLVPAPLSPRPELLRRRIWIIALATTGAAGLAALLLAGPLARRVRRLADAAAAVERGDLSVRVADGGQDELAGLGRSFDAMAEALERSRRQQRDLVSDVAHELRTPLTNVVGLIEAIQDGLRPADGATLEALRAEAGTLATLVEELQELSLAEAGRLAFRVERVDARDAARKAVAAAGPMPGGPRLETAGDGPPAWVRADPVRLGQILRNLLRNAVEHTPGDGTVMVSVSESGGEGILTVRDTGRGIPPEHLPHIFERFYRVDRSRDRASGGMGLGLAVVRQFAAAMGGRVWADSSPGRGTSVHVALPLAD